MKDPAFLFYPNDWIGGTMGMTFEEKGAYMELLMMQFNRGHMTSHMIGHMEDENLSLNKESLLMIKEENIGSNKRERKSKQITEPSEVVLLNPYCILSLDACKIELMRDQYWLEQITMSKHFSSVMETQVMLTQFFNKLKDDGVLQKSMTDAKKHFNSWIEYQKKNNNGDTKSKSATPRHDQAVAGLTSRMEELDRAFIAKQQQITN